MIVSFLAIDLSGEDLVPSRKITVRRTTVFRGKTEMSGL
jgi:hypothetical protein